MFAVIGSGEQGYVPYLQRACYAGRGLIKLLSKTGDEAVA